MTLAERLRAAASLPDDADLLAALGVKPGDRFSFGREGVRVGDQVVPLDEARLILAGGPIPQTGPRRSVHLGDL